MEFGADGGDEVDPIRSYERRRHGNVVHLHDRLRNEARTEQRHRRSRRQEAASGNHVVDGDASRDFEAARLDLLRVDRSSGIEPDRARIDRHLPGLTGQGVRRHMIRDDGDGSSEQVGPE